MLILGGYGRLGQELVKYFGASWLVEAPTHAELDITNPVALEEHFSITRPTTVLLAAAQSNVTWCQSHALEAHKLNGFAPGAVAETCAKYGAHLVYYSTDFVFDGKRETPYTESDCVNPQTEYGRSKLEGEQAVSMQDSTALILRVSRLYGEFGDNFVTRLIREAVKFLDESAKGQKTTPIRVVDDLVAAPTWTRAVAVQTERLLEARSSGLFHCSSQVPLTLFEFATQILAKAGLEAEIARCSSTEYFGEDIRPHYSVLGNCRLRYENALAMPTHEEAIARCVRTILEKLP